MLSLLKISKKTKQQETKPVFCTQSLETRSKYPLVSLMTKLWQVPHMPHLFVKQRKRKEKNLSTPSIQQIKPKVVLRKFSSLKKIGLKVVPHTIITTLPTAL